MIKNTLVYVIVILIFSSCSNVTKPLATEKPTLNDYEIGEKWTWHWKRSVKEEIRAEGEDSEEVVSLKGILCLVNGVDTVNISNILDEKPSNTPFRDWPLKVGKKWKYENSWESSDGTKGTSSQDAEIISFEEVTVAAGKFMAYKIEYKGRAENSRGYKGKMDDTWWYSPVLKTNIKHTNDDGEGFYLNELINYSKPQ